MRFALTLVLLMAAGPSHALDLLFCTLGETRHNWTPRNLVIAHEPGAGEAIVADDLVLHFEGKPIRARVLSESSRKLRFTWSLDKLKDSRGHLTPAMVYKATLTKNGQVLKMSAEPLGYSERFTGKGACRPVTEEERRRVTGMIGLPG